MTEDPDSTKAAGLAPVVEDAAAGLIGAVVGLAVGGPAGAVIGAATGPAATAGIKLPFQIQARRRERAERIARHALDRVDVEGVHADSVDALVSLLQMAVASDVQLDAAFSELAAQALRSDEEKELDRVLMIGDALAGLRRLHIDALRAIQRNGGEMSAAELSQALEFPEYELRFVVRNLELRGMIKDVGVRPIQWRIRELGQGVLQFADGEYA